MHNPCFQLPKKLKDRQELINNISQVTKSILQTTIALNITKNIMKKKSRDWLQMEEMNCLKLVNQKKFRKTIKYPIQNQYFGRL